MIILRRLQHKQGVALVEVLLATAMFGMLTTSLLTSVVAMLRTTNRSHQAVVHLFPLINSFSDPDLDEKLTPQKPIEKKLEHPPMALSYQLKKPADEWAKKYNDVWLQVAQGTWSGMWQQEQEAVVGMKYIKPKEKNA